MDQSSVEQASKDPVTSREQDAVRILLLIDGACEPPAAVELASPGLESAVGVVRTQVKLQKLDFWLRNPDYLANELLNDYEDSRDEQRLRWASEILDSEQPEVRRYPMLRHHFGAYEWLDDALAVLRSAELIARRRRGTVNRIRQHDYFLLERGRHVAREIVSQAPAFDYYVQRVKLVLLLASGQSGSELKTRQYQQPEYAEAALRTRIAAVSTHARARLATLRQEMAEQGTGEA